MELHLPDSSDFIALLISTDTAYIGDTDAVIPDADENKLMAALTALARGEIEYVILADDERFLQAAGDARSGYVLEYNDGSDKEQFRATNPQLSGNEIVDAFSAYLQRDDSWRTRSSWERIAL